MLGFNRLGSHGRFGNQLFQYAALRGIASHRGFEYCVPDHSSIKEFEGKNEWAYHQLQSCFEVPELNDNTGTTHYSEFVMDEANFNYDFFNNCPDNMSLKGYFQSEKYFKHIEDIVRKEYTFKKEIVDEVMSRYGALLNDNPVGICVRRFNKDFDYPDVNDYHKNIEIDYYKKAINLMGKDRNYIIVSNDIIWCKQQEVFNNNNFLFVDSSPSSINKGHYELCLLSLCTDNIISNSTFAWWGAWLNSNKNKNVISPGSKQWHENDDMKDLIPEGWITL